MARFEAPVVNPTKFCGICVNTSRIPTVLQEYKFNPTASIVIITDSVTSRAIKELRYLMRGTFR